MPFPYKFPFKFEDFYRPLSLLFRISEALSIRAKFTKPLSLLLRASKAFNLKIDFTNTGETDVIQFPLTFPLCWPSRGYNVRLNFSRGLTLKIQAEE